MKCCKKLINYILVQFNVENKLDIVLMPIKLGVLNSESLNMYLAYVVQYGFEMYAPMPSVECKMRVPKC